MPQVKQGFLGGNSAGFTGGGILNSDGGINQPGDKNAFGGLLTALAGLRSAGGGGGGGNQNQQNQQRREREGAGLALIRSNKTLQAALAGDAADSPAGQGLIEGLASQDPRAQNLADIAAQGIVLNSEANQKAVRKATQREALLFTLDAQKRLGELELQGYNIRAAEEQARTGFKDKAEQFAVSSTVNSMNNTLRSIENVQSIRKDLGILGPIDREAHPEAFAQVEQFMFDKIVLFKNLAEDTRVSDDDREFYLSIGNVSAMSRFFNGGEIEQEFLAEVHRRLTSTQDLYKFTYPQLAIDQPHLFSRPFRGDLGRTIDPTTALEELQGIAGDAARGGTAFGSPVGGSFQGFFD